MNTSCVFLFKITSSVVMTTNYQESFPPTYTRDGNLYINNAITYFLAFLLNIPLLYHVMTLNNHQQHTFNKSANRIKGYFLMCLLSSSIRTLSWLIENLCLCIMYSSSICMQMLREHLLLFSTRLNQAKEFEDLG